MNHLVVRAMFLDKIQMVNLLSFFFFFLGHSDLLKTRQVVISNVLIVIHKVYMIMETQPISTMLLQNLKGFAAKVNIPYFF